MFRRNETGARKVHEYIRPANQLINMFLFIESNLDDYGYEIKPLRIRDVEIKKKKLEIMDMDIPEKIYKIIYEVYNISPDCNPRFFRICTMIFENKDE